MAQHDYDLANASGPAVRADMNLALAAVVTQNSGAGAPPTTFPHMIWADTANGLFKQRDAANANWIVIGTIGVAYQGRAQPIVGNARNLKASLAAANASATFTADEVVVSTALGAALINLAGFNKTVNLATVGAGGMDTGAAPASGYVALYAIFNPSTGASALLATNATAAAAPEVYGGANMPAGYTASALVSVLATNGSSQFKPFVQRDRDVQFAGIQVLSTTTSGLGANLSISAAVPRNAQKVSGQFYTSTTATATIYTNLTVGSDTSNFGMQHAGGPAIVNIPCQGNFSNLILNAVQSLYYQTFATGTTTTFTISISGYSF